MIVDIVIIIFLITAFFRGREIGFVQQLFSTVGFFGGLLLGALLEPQTVQFVHTPVSRSMVTLATTLGMAFILLGLGEAIGGAIKQKVQMSKINVVDNAFGSLLSCASILVAVWLSTSILLSVPVQALQHDIRSSRIVSLLNRNLPAAPATIADLGHLIDPNGFPNVFIGSEPTPPDKINLPPSSTLAAAVNKDKISVVKVEGQGCGGVVEGSGFVVGDDFVATNAHVVAGISHPLVQDANGTHTAVAVWFDPNLDFAVLRVANLSGQPLYISTNHVTKNTPAAVLGYPGGGGFTAGPASVLDQFTATGRNIYNQGSTERDIYEVAADIIPGNSGGPLVASDGSVIGVIFAQSTTYNHVGYALTTQQVVQEINQAIAQNRTAGTGSCAE